MTDRAKEGIFSAIAGDIPGANVVDLYAGSGSLGLESLSRGADSVVFVEQDRRALDALRTNVEAVAMGGRVVADDVLCFLSHAAPDSRFDLAFVDPPYDLSLASLTTVLDVLVRRLHPESLVVVHRRSGEPAPDVGGLFADGERTYGTAQIRRYRTSRGTSPPGAGQDDEEEQG